MESSQPTTRPQESALIEAAAEIEAANVFCNTSGWGQFAADYQRKHPSSLVRCLVLDQYQQAMIRQRLEGTAGIEVLCISDPPAVPFDLVALAFSSQGEAELTRDLMHASYRVASAGASFVVTSDNRQDRWLHGEMQALFSRVTRCPVGEGVAYRAVVPAKRAKTKRFVCDLAFRDRGRLLHLRTRPGVFAHRRVDGGARKLLAALEIPADCRFLEIGCGAGPVTLAAAARTPTATVVAIDSNPRAIECVQWGADRNQLPNITTRLDAEGTTLPNGEFDLVAANPPYYSHFRIAELFVSTAARVLRGGGRIVLVTKHPQWYADNLGHWFTGVEFEASGLYWIARATARASA